VEWRSIDGADWWSRGAFIDGADWWSGRALMVLIGGAEEHHQILLTTYCLHYIRLPKICLPKHWLHIELQPRKLKDKNVDIFFNICYGYTVYCTTALPLKVTVKLVSLAISNH
jgi:hypothetical protein